MTDLANFIKKLDEFDMINHNTTNEKDKLKFITNYYNLLTNQKIQSEYFALALDKYYTFEINCHNDDEDEMAELIMYEISEILSRETSWFYKYDGYHFNLLTKQNGYQFGVYIHNLPVSEIDYSDCWAHVYANITRCGDGKYKVLITKYDCVDEHDEDDEHDE